MSGQEMRELERRKLNVVEALILAALLAVVGTLLALRQTVAEQAVAMKFQGDEISRLRGELIAVPALSQRLAQAEVRIDANRRDIEELRNMKGLK